MVDDGSEDDTAQVMAGLASEDPRLRYVRQANSGMSAARNHGLRLSTGRYLQFLDADDALQRRKLETQVTFLEAHDECAVVHGPWVYWDGMSVSAPPSRAGGSMLEGVGRAAIEPLLRGNVIAVNAALARADTVRAAGPFDESLGAHEDWEFWLRLALLGHRFARSDGPESMALVRVHPTSVSQDRRLMLTGAIEVRRRILGELREPWQHRLNARLLGEAEVWLGTRLGVHDSLGQGMALVLRGAVRGRSLRHLLRVPVLPLVASRPGAAIGRRLWPRLFGPGDPVGMPMDLKERGETVGSD